MDSMAMSIRLNNMSWYKNDKWHRVGDKPARVWDDGDMSWYRHGWPHRDGDKPAIIWENGSMCWYKNGSYHRVGDQPNLGSTWRYNESKW